MWIKIRSWVLVLFVILGSWKGYLAIFDPGQQEPRQIFPTQISQLPPDDRSALEEGIVVRNNRDLQQLLKKYAS